MITGQREERDRGGERESLPSIHGATDLPSFILPGPKCKVSASLSPHKSLLCWTEKGRGRRLTQPAPADERVFIDQDGGRTERKEEDGCVSNWLMRKCTHRNTDMMGNIHLNAIKSTCALVLIASYALAH